MAKQREKKPEFEVPVAYGNVNVGDETARIGIRISRGNLTVSQADKQFCGKRLTGTIVAGPPGVNGEQKAIPGMEGDLQLTGVFDCKNFSVGTKNIRTGLTFLIESINVSELVQFAKREGSLTVEAIEDLLEDEDNGDDD